MFRERFRVEHQQHWQSRGRLVDKLWREGLTTFMASAAVPEATEEDLGLNDPPGMMTAAKQRRNELLRDLLTNLESTDPALQESYFLLRSTHPWIPRRSGHFMGLLVAQQASASVDFPRLPQLNADQAAEVARKALSELLAESGG